MMTVEDDQQFEVIAHQEEQKRLAREEAEGFIRNCITELGQVGANDMEVPTLQNLLSQLEQDKTTPLEARKQAAAIFDRKHLDH